MFQIETALLKFDGLGDPQDGKASVVKRFVCILTFALCLLTRSLKIVLWQDATASDCCV
jgi:hypothetical protein